VAVVAIMVSAYTFYDGQRYQAQATTLQAFVAEYDNCAQFQERVLKLHDRGLSAQHIKDVINSEPNAPDIRDDDLFDGDVGPAYDDFYKLGCGDIDVLLGDLPQKP
jgi:hypothetical protein